MGGISQSTVISLIKSALTGECVELPCDIDLAKLYKFSVRQNVVPLIYYGLINCGFDGQSTEMDQFFISTCQYIAISEQQDDYIRTLFKELDDNSIVYLPLKGTKLRELYPRPEMRAMGDADILIKIEQYDKIRCIMQQLGYTEGVESDHELVWHKDSVVIELHKRLVPSYNKDYYKYFGDGWNKAECYENSTCYEMSNEDNLIYLFTHFAKHYRDGGIGVKHLVDIKLFLDKNNEMDFAYLKKQLKKLSLWEFFENIRKTIGVWFSDGREDDATKLITDSVLGGGAFGTAKAHDVSAALKDKKQGASKSRFKRFMILIFPSYQLMSKKYRVLVRLPVLLPFLWIWRLCCIVFKKGKRDEIGKYYGSIMELKDENINQYEMELNAVGLDFRFEEDD